MTNPTPSLAPCPFCGDTEIYLQEEPYEGTHHTIWFAKCASCLSRGEADGSPKIAKENWNRRSPPPPGAGAADLRAMAEAMFEAGWHGPLLADAYGVAFEKAFAALPTALSSLPPQPAAREEWTLEDEINLLVHTEATIWIQGSDRRTILQFAKDVTHHIMRLVDSAPAALASTPGTPHGTQPEAEGGGA